MRESWWSLFIPLQRHISIDKIKTALDLVTGATLHSELLSLGASFDEKYSHYPTLATEANEADPAKVLTLFRDQKTSFILGGRNPI